MAADRHDHSGGRGIFQDEHHQWAVLLTGVATAFHAGSEPLGRVGEKEIGGEEQMRLIDADELQMAHGLKDYDDTEQIKVTTFDQIARWIDHKTEVEE